MSKSSTESDRLDTLDELNVLDSAPEQEFDDLATLAATICGVPLSGVLCGVASAMVQGRAGPWNPRDFPRCEFLRSHPRGKKTLIVPDTYINPRFVGNSLVVGDPGIRFYAGAPITTDAGHVLGTVCVIDRRPRTLSQEQTAALEALARQASQLLKQRNSSSTNAKLASELQTALAQAQRDREKLQVAMDAA